LIVVDASAVLEVLLQTPAAARGSRRVTDQGSNAPLIVVPWTTFAVTDARSTVGTKHLERSPVGLQSLSGALSSEVLALDSKLPGAQAAMMRNPKPPPAMIIIDPQNRPLFKFIHFQMRPDMNRRAIAFFGGSTGA
jgi:hypothetical protein